MRDKINVLRLLSTKISAIHAYVDEVASGKRPVNHKILQNVCSSLVCLTLGFSFILLSLTAPVPEGPRNF